MYLEIHPPGCVERDGPTPARDRWGTPERRGLPKREWPIPRNPLAGVRERPGAIPPPPAPARRPWPPKLAIAIRRSARRAIRETTQAPGVILLRVGGATATVRTGA